MAGGLTRSGAEIVATLARAGRGRGLDPGRAVDLARAGLWLAAQGHDGVGAALHGRAELTAAIDIALAEGTHETVVATAHDALLLVGLAANTGCRFRIGAARVDADGVRGTPPRGRCTVAVEGPGAPAVPAPCGPFAVDGDSWAEAERLAALTHVPASEHSRRGAGGATPDDD